MIHRERPLETIGTELGGFVGVFFFDEASRLALAAVALLSSWEVATAIRVLITRPTGS